jgi:hypothetical protein
MPHNPASMRRLVLMHTPAHAAGEITRLMKAVREDRMPLDETGISNRLTLLSNALCSKVAAPLRRWLGPRQIGKSRGANDRDPEGGRHMKRSPS